MPRLCRLTLSRKLAIALFVVGAGCKDGTAPPQPAPVKIAGPPASIAILSGDNQIAFARTAVPAPIRVQVRDEFGKGVANTPVVFTIGEGSGSVSSEPVSTDANGIATAPAWLLGRSAVPQTLRVAVGALTATVNATVQSDYNPDIRFFGPGPAPDALTSFTAAAARLRASVVGDVPDITEFVTTPFDAGRCGVLGVTLSEIVDDVIIYATVTRIDGPGAILASAGACFIRSSSRHAIIGVMRFDSEDIAGLVTSGRLDDTVLHEMLHVVGVSASTWDPKGLIAGRGTPETRFTGVLGVAACISLGGALACPSSVPLENTGGPGTADSHWRETIFDSELMTGFIERGGVDNQYSLMTIQSLADVGYLVNTAAADPYVVPLPTLSSTRASRLATDGGQAWEEILQPRFEISNTGTIRQLRVQ